MNWHAPTELLNSYVRGDLDHATGMSLEAHTLGCAECRTRLSDLAAALVERTWPAIADVIDSPRVSFAERILERVGVSKSIARLIGTTPSMRLSWFMSTVASLAFGVVLSHAASGAGRNLPFLIIAPLLPVLAIAAVYGSPFANTNEIERATPFAPWRVLLLRSMAVLTVCVVASAVLSLGLAGPFARAWLWLAPALALSALVLALSTWVSLSRAALTSAVLWIGLAVGCSVVRTRHAGAVFDRFVMFRPMGQVAAITLALVSAVVFTTPSASGGPLSREVGMTTSVEVVELGKRYGSTVALDGVTVRLEPGVTGLLGPNGAGKTTLLRILATVLAPDQGELRLLGHRTDSPAALRSIRQRLGYCPQEPGYYNHFSAFDFVDYIAILKELDDRNARREEVRRVLTIVGLEDVMHKTIRSLSGGMRRRVAIAQALIGEPDLLILDEPTAGLDPELRLRFREVLSRRRDSQVVVLSTHQTDDIAAMCQRVIVIDAGAVRFDGTPGELAARADGHVWVSDRVDPSAQLSWIDALGHHRQIGAPPAGATLVSPTIDDAYLLLVGRNARAEVGS